ncbi:MAG TPA: GDSL-type esterase/lipase family protein [Thermoanaerobaculaceae bacterium]|nr:GDSL-type esterase/lipase family protein [Thermoanaerobaculaceae bacterium]HRS14939.1 GDSL-type esterase/lipase family protein [Thermoanaerobaculaceae bacterium]
MATNCPLPSRTASAAVRAAGRVVVFLLGATSVALAAPALPYLPARALLGLEAGESRVVRVLHFGDSHIASGPEAALVGAALRRTFGDGGAGLGLPGPLPRHHARDGLAGGSSGGWRRTAPQRGDPPRPAGLAGAYLETFRAGETAWVQGMGTSFRLTYWRQPAGGVLEVLRDGRVCAVQSLDGPAGVGVLRLAAPDSGPHRWEVRSSGRGAVRLLGVALENERGVAYSPLGQNGATAELLLACEERVFTELLQIEQPDVVILAFGTNEAGDPRFDPPAYERVLHRVMARIRAARPEAAVILAGPPERGDGRGTAVAAVTAAQRRVAEQGGGVFVDRLAGMGGAGSARRWASASPPLIQPDMVHFTAPGYARLAAMVLEGLVEAFNATKASRSFRSALRLREARPEPLLAAADRPTALGSTEPTGLVRAARGEPPPPVEPGGVTVVRDAQGRVRITNLAGADAEPRREAPRLRGGSLAGGRK